MTLLKQLAMWSAETLCEALLLMILLTVLWRGSGQSPLVDDLRLAFFGTLFVFMVGSGYLLTTSIFGVFWRSRIPWAYPLVAAVLFIAHVQFFVTGWDASTKVPVQFGGACIVFVCTFLGGSCLRRWEQSAG